MKLTDKRKEEIRKHLIDPEDTDLPDMNDYDIAKILWAEIERLEGELPTQEEAEILHAHLLSYYGLMDPNYDNEDTVDAMVIYKWVKKLSILRLK